MDGQRTVTDPCLTDRRALLAGAAALLAAPAQASAQDEEDDAGEADVRYVANLLTRMAIRVSLNGVQDLLFVIDTGAERTVVATEVAEQLGLRPGPMQLIHGVTAAVTAPSVHIERLTLAGRTLHGLTSPIFPRAALGADGLVGLDALASFELRIDLERRTVGLRPATDQLLSINPVERTTGTRLNRPTNARAARFGQMLLPVEIEGVRMDAFIDSGAQYSIGNRALLRALGPRERVASPSGDPRVHGVGGATLSGDAHRVRGMRIAGRRLGGMRLTFADLHVFDALGLQAQPALLLGADILARFNRISLNFARSEVSLSAPRRLSV